MDFDDLGPEWLFRICGRMHRSMIAREFERRGLGEASHPFMLFMLDGAGKGASLSQRELASGLGVSPPTAAVSIRRMERAGLLRKVEDADDRRSNRITLTPKGARLVRECRKAFDEIDVRMFEGFSEREREALRASYLKMARNLEAMGAQCPEHVKEKIKT